MHLGIRPLIGILALGAALFAPGAGQAASARGYTMYCRGGQGLTDVLAGDKKVVFKKHVLHGNAAFGTSTLSPGTCTWADRGMRADEPRQLMFVGRFNGYLHTSTVGGFEIGQAARVDGEYRELDARGPLAWIDQLRDPGYVIELTAHRDTVRWAESGGPMRNVGVFRITSFDRAIRVHSQSNRG